ncbi:MAG: NAD(P)-binding protein, partial [Pseudomonadota bacterium]
MSSSTSAKTRVAVLGGGLGSLSTVYHLTSDPDWAEKYDITVYQLGWRLGGKCASGRNLDCGERIQEHGVHMFMGFYKHAFAMMQICYQELDRPSGAPLATLDKAFKGHSRVTFKGKKTGTWHLKFPPTPGNPADAPDHLSVWHLLVVALEWVHQLTSGGKPGCLGGIWHMALVALKLRQAASASPAGAD